MDWGEVKIWLDQTPVSKDALHIYAALFVQVATAFVSRRTLGSFLPWSAVLIADLINEGLDMFLGEEDRIQPWQVAGALHDLGNTLAVPTILLLLVRYVPSLFEQRPSPPRG